MSTANSQDHNCQDGVCETTFKPVRQTKNTFSNLKAMAGDLLTKVKETLTGEHDVINADDEQSAEKGRLARMQQQTVQDRKVDVEAHVSMHSAEIIERFKQNNWNPQAGAYQPVQREEALRVMNVKSSRPSESQMKAGRYDNPWRYDNRH